jgi:geranylgeranyl diphosphate synthase type II
MLILATNILSNMNQWFMQLAKLFNKTAEVCEGQQWDVDFETRVDVTIRNTLKD